MDPRKAYSPWEKENKDDNRWTVTTQANTEKSWYFSIKLVFTIVFPIYIEEIMYFRFNCFSCDFDICKKCIVKQEKKYREDCEEEV